MAVRDRLLRGDRTGRRGWALARDALGRGGVADYRGVDGGHRADVSRNLRRQPYRRRLGNLDAWGLSCVGVDGSARTTAIADGELRPHPVRDDGHHKPVNSNKPALGCIKISAFSRVTFRSP